MELDRRNQKYIQELNEIKADETLKKRILSEAEKQNRKRIKRPFFYSAALFFASVIIITLVLRKSDMDKNAAINQDDNSGMADGQQANKESKGEKEAPVEDASVPETMPAGEFISMRVIISGSYGQEDFKILFEYNNGTRFEMLTGRSFYIETENADGSYSLYEPEQDLPIKDDAWIIEPGTTRTENMTAYFMTGYPELTKSIVNGAKVRICDDLCYIDGTENGSETIKSRPELVN